MAPSSSQLTGKSSSRKGRTTGNEVDTVTLQGHGQPSPASPSIRPQFMQAEPGQPFCFRLPVSAPVEKDVRAPARSRFGGASSPPSNGSVPPTERYTQPPTRTRFPGTSSQASVPSSHGASLFSGGSSGGVSTAPTSRAPSVCSSSGEQCPAQQRTLPLTQHASSRFATTLRTHAIENMASQRDHEIASTRLQRTTYFYNPLLNTNRTGHSLSATPDLYGDTPDAQPEVSSVQ